VRRDVPRVHVGRWRDESRYTLARMATTRSTPSSGPPLAQPLRRFTYDAFLSYSRHDQAVADGIQKGLHRIGRRAGQLHALRVFRDKTDLAASPDLWGRISDALDRSRYLILVLSPQAAVSYWVDREVEYWLDTRGPERVQIVVADGTLDWDDVDGRFDAKRSTAALPVLTRPGVLVAEPIFVDVSGDAPWDAHAPAFRDKVTDLAAPIHGKSKYELSSADVREQRRFRRLRRAAVAGLAILTIISATAAVIAFREYTKALAQATGLRLVGEAEQMLEGSRPEGDVRALQQLLAAHSFGATSAEAVSRRRQNLLKIFENPPRPEGDGAWAVRSVAISKDNSHIAWANDDKTVRLWDATTNKVHTLATGGSYPAKSVTFSPDGSLLAAGSGSATLLLWHVGDLSPAAEPIKHSQSVVSTAFSRDGKWIATGCADGTVRVFDSAGHPRFTRVAAHDPHSGVDSVAFSADGKFVISGGSDTSLRRWNADTGELAGTFKEPVEEAAVAGVSVNPSGDRAIVARIDGTMQLVDASTLRPRSPTIQAHPNDIGGVAFSPDGVRIVTGGGDNTVRVFDASSLAQIGDPMTGHHGAVSSVAYSADGSEIVSGGWDGSVRVWDAVTGVPLPAQQGKEIRSVAFSPNGRQVASAGTDGTVKLWDTATATLISQLSQPCPIEVEYTCAINALAFDPNNPHRLLTGSTNGEVRVWDLNHPGQSASLEIRTPPGIPADAPRRVKSVAFSPDGSMIVAAGYDSVVRLWNGQVLSPIDEASAHAKNRGDRDVKYQVWSVAFSHDGTRLVTGSGYDFDGSDGNYLQLWTLNRSKRRPLNLDGDPIIDHKGWSIYSVAFGPRDEHVASGGYDGTVRVFDVGTPHTRRALMGSDQNPVLSMAFAHNKPWLATGGTDGNIRLWDTSTMPYQPIGTPLTGHHNWVQGVTFSPDDEQILSGSADQTLRLWSSPTDFTKTLCSKLTANMSHKQWDDWVARGSPVIRYRKLCDNLPIPADS
jgi:WD40 repeat protein